MSDMKPEQVIFFAVESLISGDLVFFPPPGTIDVILLDEFNVSITDHNPDISVDEQFWGKLSEDVVLSNPGYYIGWLFFMNAMLESIQFEFRSNGAVWQQLFSGGNQLGGVTRVRAMRDGENGGTTITLRPNFMFVAMEELDYSVVARRLNEIAALKAGWRINLCDRRTGYPAQSDSFYYENGLVGLVESLCHEPLHMPVHGYAEFDIPDAREAQRMQIEIAFCYVAQDISTHLSYANTETMHGTHHDGMIAALHHALNIMANETFDRADIITGLVSAVSVYHIELQTLNGAVTNRDLEEAAFELTVNTIGQYAEQHPDQMQRIIEKCLANKRTREV